MRSVAATVVTKSIHGRDVSFFVAEDNDAIQKHHRAGRFYEAEELAIIADHFAAGSTFIDIGANVGNHTMYALMFLGARRATVFEPNPPAIELCRINLALNGLLPLVDTSHLGLGLSNGPGRATVHTRGGGRNLGAAQLKDDHKGPVRLTTGDEALAGQTIDFVKIDVEAMEIRVLAGLKETIQRARPTLFIEVDDENTDEFGSWLSSQSYRVANRYRRYKRNENLLCLPAEAPA